MDSRIYECPNLSERDVAQIRAIVAGMPITADVSRADMLLCCLLTTEQALVVQHILPQSISSLYREEASGRTYMSEKQPLLLRTLHSGRGGRRQRETLTSRAPVIQDVHPILNDEDRVIAALVVESNMFAHERHRGRSRIFRQAVDCLQDMCMRGELECTHSLSRFGQYDGIYVADSNHSVIYMNGIAANLFRSIGLHIDLKDQRVSDLEPLDNQMVDEVLGLNDCAEHRHEAADGRVWIRKALPLRMATVPFQLLRFYLPRHTIFSRRQWKASEAVLVLIHNATEAVQRQRELNVKSAIIQEVHHRVKNNLQTVAAILRIQARRVQTEEARQQLSDAVNRILSVAVIHEFLSEDEHQPINIRDVCQRVADQVRQVAGNPDQKIEIAIVGPNIRLPASQATPVAMVMNELVLNAMEHGLGDRQEGRIEIELRDLGESVQVTVQNSGRALPPDFDPQESSSLGLQIVHTLVTDDLKGELQIEPIADKSMIAATSSEQAQASVLRKDRPSEEPYGTRAVITFPRRSLRVD